MLHIATVHYASPRWIEIQTRYLRQYIQEPYQTWTSLELIDPSYASYFDHVIDQRARHSDKLNHLAIEIAHEAADADLLMFLDGDAFPIADPMPLIRDALARAPLLAVRRAEYLNDQQPHPCFCVTTVGAWREIPGDWSPGYRWVDASGARVSDVGGNLLRQLQLTDTPWVELTRSNRHDVDPYCFAVYGDVVYHHSTGFRTGRLPRVHLAAAPEPKKVPFERLLPVMAQRYNWWRRKTWVDARSAELTQQSERIYERISVGGTEWLTEFM